jgi:hypothetical protein
VAHWLSCGPISIIIIIIIIIIIMWSGTAYSDPLRAGRSGDRIPVDARFSTPVQTGPGAHPASCAMGTGSFPGVKRLECGVTTHPHLAPRVKKD